MSEERVLYNTVDGKTELERAFETWWTQLGGPELEFNYRFHGTRKWMFDFAHLDSRVAIELEGGNWTGGRHVTGRGFEEDCQKYNAAARLGWRLFRFTSNMLRADPAGHLEPVIMLMEADHVN